MPSTYDELRQLLALHDQTHLLRFWDQLDDAEQAELAAEIRQLDLDPLLRAARADSHENFANLALRAVSPPAVRLNQPDRERWSAEARRRGAEELAAGRVGCLLVAGGQGSRLGFEAPKGMYPIGPISRASLFQILLEKIAATSARYGAPVPLYLMTSPATHEPTIEYLRDNDHFGIPAAHVHIFCQGMLPALDAATNQVLLAAPGHIALSPDGHGGMLAALSRSGGLDDMRSRGLAHLFYFQVDNPLATVCDPETIGAHLMQQSEFTLQVVAKQDPAERVGVVASIDGRMRMIEYSDLPADAAAARDAEGGLKLWAGSIAVNMFSVDFLHRAAGNPQSLPLHRALKKVAHIDAQGQPVEPQQPNAIKLERFIFDLLPQATRGLVVEVDPAEAFAPLKNPSGDPIDTPEYVRGALAAQARRWLRTTGAEVADGVNVEISPRFALDAAALAEKIKPGTMVTQDTYFS